MAVLGNEQQDSLIKAIAKAKWSEVEIVWADVLSGDPLGFSFHQPIIDKLLRKQQHEFFSRYYQPFIEGLLKKNRAEEALELLQYIVTIDEKELWLRLACLQSITASFTPTIGARVHDVMEKAGLKDENVGLRKGMQKFEDLMGATKGQVFLHQMWGLGIVKELDLVGGNVIIDFALKKSAKLTLDGVRGFLIRVPKDHLQAKIALEPDALKVKCKEAPAEVVTVALRGTKGGRLKVADLKRLLTTRFLTENEYKSFWESARKAIRLDPWIDQSGTGVHAELILRSEPRSFFENIFAEFLTAKDTSARRNVLRDVRKHGSDAAMTDEDSEALFGLFCKPVTEGLLKTEAEKFNHGMLFIEFSELFEGKQNPVDVETLLKPATAVELVRHLDGHELRKAAMEMLIEAMPKHWVELYVDLTIYMDSRTVTWMTKELMARKEEDGAHAALESILAKPSENPELFVWAARNIFEGNWNHLGNAITPILICEEILSLLSELEESFEDPDKEVIAEAKAQAAKLRQLLNDGNSKYFKKAVNASTVEEGRRVLQSIRLHNALSNQLKAQLENILINKHEELRKVSRLEEEEEKRKPAYHYTTSTALDEKRSHLANLVGVEIPGMAKVIEVAREHGDLRENSEYHAAKERQKLLMQHAAELEELIARARVVSDLEANPQTSRFGTAIKYVDTKTNDVRDLTLLGMWEADQTKGIISYLTPFGSQLLGRQVGDKFEVTSLDGKTVSEFEVLEVRNAMPGTVVH